MTLFHLILCLLGGGVLTFVVLQNIIASILREKRYSGNHTLMNLEGINPVGTIGALREVTEREGNAQAKQYYQRIARLYGTTLIGMLVTGFIGLPLAYNFSYGELDKQLEKAELKALSLPLPSDTAVYAFLNEVLPAETDPSCLMVDRNIGTFDLSPMDSMRLIGLPQLFSPLDRFFIYRQNDHNGEFPVLEIDTALFHGYSVIPKGYGMEFPEVIYSKAFWNGFHDEYGDSTGFFCVSRPYFSVDRNVAILHIETFFDYGKANGHTWIFRRMNGKWKKSSTLRGWKA